jgi:hypothetical protein
MADHSSLFYHNIIHHHGVLPYLLVLVLLDLGVGLALC